MKKYCDDKLSSMDSSLLLQKELTTSIPIIINNNPPAQVVAISIRNSMPAVLPTCHYLLDRYWISFTFTFPFT